MTTSLNFHKEQIVFSPKNKKTIFHIWWFFFHFILNKLILLLIYYGISHHLKNKKFKFNIIKIKNNNNIMELMQHGYIGGPRDKRWRFNHLTKWPHHTLMPPQQNETMKEYDNIFSPKVTCKMSYFFHLLLAFAFKR